MTKMNGGGNAGDGSKPRAQATAGISAQAAVRGNWRINVFDLTWLGRLARMALSADRFAGFGLHPLLHRLRESRAWENLVTTEGKNYLLATGLDAGTAITAWYVGLVSGSPSVAAGDVMNSHGGWTEVVAYDEATREVWTGGTASAGSIDNTAASTNYAINANSTTIGGAFLASDSAKSGTTGTLYAVGAFTGGNIVLNDGSTLQVDATFTV